MKNSRKPGGAEPANYQWKAKVIKSLAHPSRLAMLNELGKGEKCVCELQKLVGADITTVSKHLSLMKRAGVVEDRREGVWIYYRLKVPCILRVFDCIEVVLDNNRACCASAPGGSIGRQKSGLRRRRGQGRGAHKP